MSRSRSTVPHVSRGAASRRWVALLTCVAAALLTAGPASGAVDDPALEPALEAATAEPAVDDPALEPALEAAVAPSISGVVTGPTGAGLGGVRVYAYTANSGYSTFVTATDGSYAITGLATGQYTVVFDGRTAGYLREYYNDAAKIADADLVSVTAGVATTGINAQLVKGGTISGVVNGPSGPLAGIQVSASELTTYEGFSATTGADGKYTISGLAAGQYRLEFGGWNSPYVTEYYNDKTTTTGTTPVAVTLGATTPDINATLVLGGTISGTITGPAGPVDAWITARSSDGTYSRTAYSDYEDGTYQVKGLLPGTYTIQVEASYDDDGLAPEFYNDALSRKAATPVTVTGGATTAGIDVALVDAGSIAGTVTGPGGPVSGVDVWVWNSDMEDGGSAETDASGHYAIDGLAAGAYEVEFYPPSASGLRSEYYNNSPSYRTATLVPLTAGQDRTGIDAVLANVNDPLFTDVPPTAPFFDEIEWLADIGITSGWPDGTFHPSAPVERQAMAAFLYRFAGEPSFTLPATPSFKDVPATSPFYTEIEWLVSTGITTGWPDGTFRPSATVERQAMAAFLYRFAEEPTFTSPATATFPDVPTTAKFFREVEWLASTKITTGWPDGTFRPSANVERQAMAAFLKRFNTWL